MADAKLLEILKQDVEAFNSLRERKEVRYSFPDLSKADLSGAKLRKVHFNVANLSGASLRRADLSQANLIMASLDEADLSGANLSSASLSSARLTDANLTEAFLFSANLSDADLSGAKLRKANLIFANLRSADLSRANLFLAKLDEADLNKANLSGANIRGTNLSGANLSHANLSNSNISGADITGANLHNWKIERIKCTHIIRNGKKTDYSNPDDFEKAFTNLENIVEMLIDMPFSDLGYYTGQIIQEAINQKFGLGSVIFKGHTAISDETISDETTKLEFFSWPEKLPLISKQLSELSNQLKPVIEEAKSNLEPQSLIGIKPEIDLPFSGGSLVVRSDEVGRVLKERCSQMHPVLQSIIHTIQLHIR